MITAAILLCLSPVVIDGDTFRCGRSPTTVRVFGVQAPEIGQPGDLPARNALAQLLAGGVMCEPRGTSYSRITAICMNSAAVDIGQQMLRTGHATEWCSYSKNLYGTCILGRSYPK
jgi:endonuclease YncB( thermonuclease family)